MWCVFRSFFPFFLLFPKLVHACYVAEIDNGYSESALAIGRVARLVEIGSFPSMKGRV